MLNPFLSSNAFSMVALTMSMNRLPYNTYGRVGELGLFGAGEGITSNVLTIEEMGGVLNLIPSRPRGGPDNVNSIGKRKMRSFSTVHLPLDDVVMPEEVQNIRAFGSENEMDTIANKIAMKQMVMKNKHDQTLEWLRVGALKGVLLDADATTVLYNFFTEFGISAHTQAFAFSSGATDVLAACVAISRWMEDNLHGEVMTGVRALCSPEFFDALVSHASVKSAFQYFRTNQPPGYDYRKGFEFGGITFEEYRGTATDPTGAAHKFITASTAQFFPEGTNTTFKTFYGPADFNETVNTPGLPYYSKMVERKFGRGYDLHTQSNPFPICVRPELLVQGTMS